MNSQINSMLSPLLVMVAAMVHLAAVTTRAELVFSASGPTVGSIQGNVDAFRDSLGTLNPPDPVNQPDGRRQVNWDAAPATVSIPNTLPGDFFNQNFSPRSRGIEFSTPGSELRLSGDVDDVTPVRFEDINPSYASEFQAFSQERLFTPVNSTQVEVRFFNPAVPGQPAVVDGLGVVFADVDTLGSATIEYYDPSNNLLTSETVPRSPGGLSFLGVHFDSNELFRAVITSGTTPVGPNDDPANGIDIVVMDDFIFGEPVPEPTTGLLLVLGAIALLCRRRR